MFVLGPNASGDFGGITTDFDGSVAEVSPVMQVERWSAEHQSGERKYHTSRVVSIKGCSWYDLGSLAVLLDNGEFLIGGGDVRERRAPGNLIHFKCLSDVKVKKISAGSNHVLLLTDAGTVYSMLSSSGVNVGQLGSGDYNVFYVPSQIPRLSRIRRIRAGFWSSCFVDSSRNLWVSGSSDGFFPFDPDYNSPTLVEEGCVLNVFSGPESRTTFIQKTDGHVYAAGLNDSGQCGIGFTTHEDEGIRAWTKVLFESKVECKRIKKISCSGGASFALLSDGSVASCGKASENGFAEDKTRFSVIRFLSDGVLDLACGDGVTVLLTATGGLYITDSTECPFRVNPVGAPGYALLEAPWGGNLAEKCKVSVWAEGAPNVFVLTGLHAGQARSGVGRLLRSLFR